MVSQVAGYTFGTQEVSRSPVSLDDLERLKQTVMFTDEDSQALRMAGQVLSDQIEAVLDVWYRFMASQPHLARYFSGADGRPDPAYLTAVRRRFGQWILDTCNRPYDQAWLDYQQEIALRHIDKKNETDHVKSATPIVNFRYIVAAIYPFTVTIRPFLARKGHSPEQVEKMYNAWFKSIALQVALWGYPYIKDGDF